jgi:hypothetical protein
MTVPAMRAAVMALREGAFDGLQPLAAREQVSSGPCGPIGQGLSRGGRSWTDVRSECCVLVLAGHAGAGASTVALAVAEGLASGRRVQLLEYAEPAQSGLVAASDLELGVDDLWRRGRRGEVELLRLARPVPEVDLPAPPPADEAMLQVIDPGWSRTVSLLTADAALPPVAATVVVTRLTVPAVRQTEQVLARARGDVWVAAVGSRRWPRAVRAGCGAHLARLVDRGRVVPVPVDRRLATLGLTGDPLPGPVAAAGRSLAAQLVPAGSARRRRHAAASTAAPARSRG